jgi:hypothetical protein
MAGFGGDSVLFVGDHIYGDILRSKKTSTWRTAMIVQEMEDELAQAREMREELQKIETIDREITRLNAQLTYDQGLAYQLDAVLDDIEAEPVDADDLEHADADTLRQTRGKLREAQRRMRRRRHELIEELRETERSFEDHFNPYWGLIFRQENENTLFGEQVEDFACVYTSRVSNFLNYSPMHYFRASRQPLPHEQF